MSILRDCLTSKDGESFHFAKVFGFAIMVLFMIISFWCYVVRGMAFDPNMWGGVATTIYTAVNAAIRYTHVTEP